MARLLTAVAAILALGLASASAQHIALQFPYGVASGDPLPNAIILWTAVVPELVLNPYETEDQYPSFPLQWSVYSDAALTRTVQTGTANATVDTAYTVKVDVKGLDSGVNYFYNFVFTNGSITSDTGRFRLPQPLGTPQESFAYAVFSCSNFPTGYFNAYDAASRYDLDAWFHVGDWLYEYGVSVDSVRFQPPPEGLQPATDIVTLDDYRRRHALYRRDPGLRALSAAAPLMSIWDDHEFANNVFDNGADNQHPGQLDYQRRRANAAQAYYEFMPIRAVNGPDSIKINRTFAIGDLATIFMLEDRVTQRTDAGQDCQDDSPGCLPWTPSALAEIVGDTPVSKWNSSQIEKIVAYKDYTDERRTDPEQRQLGPAQLAWVQNATEGSAAAGVPWQLYFEGTVMQDWYGPDLEGAIAAESDPDTAAYWAECVRNVTELGAEGNATYTSWALTPTLVNQYGTVRNVTAAIASYARGALATGRYRLNSDFDSWQGYLAERTRFAEAISGANTAVVHAGDSHNFWTGYVTSVDSTAYRGSMGAPADSLESIVAVEFDGGSVSSEGNEGDGTFPLDLVNAAFIAANNGSMVHCENRYKGGMYGQLTKNSLHMEYIYVNTIAVTDYVAWCGDAFDVAATGSDSQPEIRMGRCGPVPDILPYAQLVNQQNTRMRTVGPAIPTGTGTPVPAAGSSAAAGK